MLRDIVHETKKRFRRKQRDEKAVSDVAKEGPAHRIVLRERALRFELSVKKTKRFVARHRRMLFAACGLILAIAGAHVILRGFANTAVFYPSSCLGNWEGVQNALGHPDVPPGSPDSDFTGANSAVLASANAQVFCGNFSGDIALENLADKEFQSASLALSWNFRFPEPQVTDDAEHGTLNTEQASATESELTSGLTSTVQSIVSSSDSTSESTPVPSNIEQEASQESGFSTGQAENMEQANGEENQFPSDGMESGTEPAQSDILIFPPEPPPPTEPESTPEPPPPPEPPIYDAASPSPAEEPTPTSFLRRIVPFAYAEEIEIDQSSTVSMPTTTKISEWHATDTEPTAISVDTSITEVAPRPRGEEGDVLNISFSTDGVNWTPLMNINKENWREGRYEIPIHSWEELRNLQIMFVGLDAPEMPKIYLDATGIEVSYGDAEPIAPETDSDSNMTDPLSNDSSPPAPPPPPAPSLLPVAEHPRQSCEVEPFSTTLYSGGNASLRLALHSGFPLPEGTSTVPVMPLYDVVLGSMPRGVTASFGNTITSSIVFSTRSLHVAAGALAENGSYNVVVLYRERQENGNIVPQYCQFNLVVE